MPPTVQETAAFKPYVPAERDMTEITVRALVLGAILSVVMAAANAYLGLLAGMTVSASIPAAVISMAILRGIMRRGSILENNVVQTMASTGESLAAGVIFTVPALVMIGEWQDFEFWPTTLITLLGGLLGILFMVPMRRALIVDRPDLTYPEGVACSEVLITGEEGGSGVKAIGIGLGVGFLFKILASGINVVQSVVEGAVTSGRRIFYFGSEMSVALLAVGYIVNLQIAALIFLGGAIGWVIALPLLGGFEAGLNPVDAAYDVWSNQIRYIGVGTMLVGGLWSLWSVRSGIVAGLTSLRGATPNPDGTVKAIPRTERNLPMTALMTIFLLTCFATFFFYDYLVNDLQIAGAAVIMTVITSFIFVAVATYIAGLVGSSNSPVSGMTICALLITAGVLVALGIEGDSAILATLGVAGVVCCATCTSGDVAQDLKTGLLLGATPAKQQTVEVIACVIPAFFFAPILSLLHGAYGIGTDAEGALRAPQAGLFASLTEGFFGDLQLPTDMITIGVAIGIALIVINFLLERSGSSFRTHVMPIAVGIYLPFSLAIPIIIGGLLRYLVGRKVENEGRDSGVLFGSGLIAGEALMGILLAIVIASGFDLPIELLPANITWMTSLVVFGFVVWLFAHFARQPIED